MASGRSLWNIYARVYDHILLRFHPYRELLLQVKESMEAQDGWRILDAGCGTGNTMKAMLGSAANLSLTGVDLEMTMLERARAKLGLNSTGNSGRLTLQQANLDLPLPFSDGEFDGIVCINTLYALKNHDQFVRECGRLLKLNGRLVLVTPPEKPRMGPLFNMHIQVIRRKYPLYWFFVLSAQLLRLTPSLLPFLVINMIIQRKGAFTFFSEKELISLVQRCGYNVTNLAKTYGEQAWLLVCTKLPEGVMNNTAKEAGA